MTSRRNGSRLAFNGNNYLTSVDPGSCTYRHGTNAVAAMKVWTDIGTSSATTGQVTFTYPSGFFSSINSVQATTWHTSALVTCTVKDVTGTGVTIQVLENKTSGVLLGGIIDGLKTATTQVQVFLTVTGT